MKITIQDIHTYNNLVKVGKATPLGNPDQILIPKLLDDDEVVLYDISSGDTIRPGINLQQKILKAIDQEKNV
jgi:hypothetical protein